jgi:hypothetical protein
MKVTPRPVAAEPLASQGQDDAALRSTRLAFYLYLLFMVSWFVHIPERVPAVGLVRIDLMLVCLISALIGLNSVGTGVEGGSRTGRLIMLLVGYAVITAPFVQWPGSVLKVGLPNFAKAVVFYYFTKHLVLTERRLALLMFVFVSCQSVRILEPVYLHLTEGYWGSAASMLGGGEMPRLSGAPSDVVNPNGLAFVIVTVIPFFHYVWTMKVPGALTYAAVLPVCLYGLILTGSRSGLVGLAIIFTTIWLRSSRKLVLTAAACLAVVAAVPFLSADQKDRYLSIVDSDTRNAATAQGRIDGITEDLRVAMRRPFLGYGLGTSREANTHFGDRAIPSHNLVTQVVQELGMVGLSIFLLLIGTIFRNVRRSLHHFRKIQGGSRLLLRLSQALDVWLVMNILNSLFTYGLSSYDWYFIAGLAEVLTRLSRASALDTQEHLAPVAAGTEQLRLRAVAAADSLSRSRARNTRAPKEGRLIPNSRTAAPMGARRRT